MPELPEVEVLRRGLESHLTGCEIKRVRTARYDLRYPLPDLDAVLSGCIFRRIGRRGRYLLFFFDHVLLVWHLGMTGQFHILAQEAPAGVHEHVSFTLSGGTSLRYRDARRFGYAALLPEAGWQQHHWFRNMGPEPFADAFNADYLISCCWRRRASIKQVLMDARVVAGIGNIYASEALHRAGIHPARAAKRISGERLHRLVDSLRQVLSEAIAAGGSTISDFVRADGRPGYFAHAFQVYGRRGKPCLRCGTAIRRIVQSGRSTFYCPACQH